LPVEIFLTAEGFITRPGEAVMDGVWVASAYPGLMFYGLVDIQATSTATSEAYANAEIPDPDARTMYRMGADRAMRRAFNDTTMRRQA